MPTSYTPLRYPGGKSRLANFIKLIIRTNRLGDVHYVEPYAGGGGLALSLLFHGYARAIYLNDINKAIYAFWFSAKNHSDDLCKRIDQVKVTMKEWEKQQQVFRNAGSHTLQDLGFAALFLNRTNRSGILSGGVIGGKGQTGKWKIDARFNKATLKEKIRTIARYKQRIHLYNLDAFEFIKDVIPSIRKNGLVYLDPPYFVKGQDLYENFYNAEDHVTLATLVREHISHPWVISYDNAPTIRKLYSGFHRITYGIPYCAGEHYEGSELMCFSPGLRVPRLKNPLLVSREAISSFPIPS
ncbi:MAG: DNA adenine methylase [Nitrospinae bacterium]|nr:DNA adenine methylase [Nitrospinota bacterium]